MIRHFHQSKSHAHKTIYSLITHSTAAKPDLLLGYDGRYDVSSPCARAVYIEISTEELTKTPSAAD